MLANRTPPTCIQANIYAMSRALFPGEDIVVDLPSLRHIKYLRTALTICTKTLAAYRLGNAKAWKQAHNDETARRQTSLINLVMYLLNEDDEFETICLSGSIIATGGTAEEQSEAILHTFKESGRFLQTWRDTHEKMYPEDEEGLNNIPKRESVSAARMNGATISHDT